MLDQNRSGNGRDLNNTFRLSQWDSTGPVANNLHIPGAFRQGKGSALLSGVENNEKLLLFSADQICGGMCLLQCDRLDGSRDRLPACQTKNGVGFPESRGGKWRLAKYNNCFDSYYTIRIS